ncbi:MAG: hypothetical protein EA356_05650 [Geminicoccaceae bacterium]|nr:MAG: hypothetical protein EA356_05650 [Geminicoccaceae bacterium]
MPREPLIRDDGEVRELTEDDFARGRLGAPWTRPTDVARQSRRNAIAALERAEGAERVAVARTLDHLCASLTELDRLVAER